MKHFLLGLLIATPTMSFSLENRNTQILNQLDGICADTWCGGDLNFRFDRLDCDSASCFLEMASTPYFPEGKGWSSFRCEFPGWTERDLWNGDNGFPQYSDKLFEAVGDCLRAEQDKKPKSFFTPKFCGSPRITRTSSSAFENEEVTKEYAAAKSLAPLISSECPSEVASLISCTKVGLVNTVCLIEQDEMHAILVRDQVDNSSLITFHPGKAPELKLEEAVIPEVSECYSEMVSDGDHRTVFFTEALPLGNPAAAWTKVVRNTLPASCPKENIIGPVECKKLGDYSLCAGSSERGVFLVGTLSRKRSFTSFIRFD